MSLTVVDQIITLAREITAVVEQVRPHNKELASQLERSWTRTASGAAEAQHRRGEKGRNRLDDAYGEARESMASLRYAQACRWARVDESLLQRVDGVAAQLYVLARRAPG